MNSKTSSIGILNENSLHASLKKILAQEGDLLEAPVHGYLVDIVHGDILIEVQTKNFFKIKQKLVSLLDQYSVRLVYPILQQKWIIKEDPARGRVRRKSPRRGKIDDIFYELVYLAALAGHPNFSLVLCIVEIEEIQVPGNQVTYSVGWRRKGWAVADQRLLAVKGQMVFSQVEDYLVFLEPIPPEVPFNVRQFSQARRISENLARKIIYTLCKLGVIEKVGKDGRRKLYQRKYCG